MLLSSCYKKPHVLSSLENDEVTVSLRVSPFEKKPFDTRVEETLANVCTRLEVAVFAEDGSRVVKKNQVASDEDFGQPVFQLVPGNYTLVVIAHNGMGVATLSKVDEVTFSSNKVTDTFYACEPLIVEEADVDKAISLVRPVAMVRFVFTDEELPADFYTLKIYYTGGSSTFNPTTGFGSKESRQTEYRAVEGCITDTLGSHIFEVYTFPHTLDDVLKIKLTPQNEDGEDLTAYQKEFEGVEVSVNEITEYRGIFFTSGSALNSSLGFGVQTEWNDTTVVEF